MLSLVLYPVMNGLTIAQFFTRDSWLLYSVPLGLFVITHWIFAWHYFKVACIFKLSFLDHTLDSLMKLQKRTKMLNIIFAVTLMIIFSDYTY